MVRASSIVSTGSVTPGTIGTPAASISARARIFEPMASIASGDGPMNTSPASAQARANVGVLGKEAVAGMDGLGTGAQARSR